MEIQFYSGAHGNYSRWLFPVRTLSGVNAVNNKLEIGYIPPGVEIHKVELLFGDVDVSGSGSGTRIDLGFEQDNLIGEASTWTDDLDQVFDNETPADNKVVNKTFFTPVYINAQNVKLKAQVKGAAMIAANTIPMTVAVEYIARGTQ